MYTRKGAHHKSGVHGARGHQVCPGHSKIVRDPRDNSAQRDGLSEQAKSNYLIRNAKNEKMTSGKVTARKPNLFKYSVLRL